MSSQTVTSTSGLLLGTVAYLSPEQVERGIADARSDVYAAGLVLFEMLTSTKAFTGDTPIHVAYQHVHGGVPVPSDRVPGLPPALDDLVAVATARDPDERPTDAADFLALVRRTRATLSTGALDARPAGAAAAAAASVPRDRRPPGAAPARGGRRKGPRAGSGVATRSRSEHTTAMTVPRLRSRVSSSPGTTTTARAAGGPPSPPRPSSPRSRHGSSSSDPAPRPPSRRCRAVPRPRRSPPCARHPRPAGQRGVRREGAQGRRRLGAAHTGHRGAPRAPTWRSWSPRVRNATRCPRRGHDRRRGRARGSRR